MTHALPFSARRTRRSRAIRHALLLFLGLAILTGLLLSDTPAGAVSSQQGFSETRQSLSFMPETVRVRPQP